MGALDKLRTFFGLSTRAAAVPPGYELKGGVVVASAAQSTAPKRGTRELLQAFRESPRLRAVASRIARGVAALQVEAYVRVADPGGRASGVRHRRDTAGRYRDVGGVPVYRWGVERGVRDVALISGGARMRARRRVELARAGVLREVPDHPLLELLATPNPEMSGRTLLYVTQVHLDLKGESFWLIGMRDGKPASLWPVPPHWVRSTPTSTTPWFTVSAGGVQLQVPPENVIWFREPDPENPYGRGTGVGESLGDEIETDEYAAKYLKNFFFNSAMPAAFVSFEGANEQQVKAMKERWEQEHRGYSNAHRVHFGMGKMNAQKLDASLRDQQMTELRAFSRDAIAQVFAVPPEMVGIIENSNRSTIGAATYIYALGVEVPRAEFLRDELQRQFAPLYDDSLALEVEVQIPDDEGRRLDVMRAMPGAFDLNAWRDEAGYEPLAQFDGVFPPLTLPGQQPSSPPAEEPKPEPEEPEDEPDDTEDGSEDGTELSEKALPADPPWARRLS